MLYQELQPVDAYTLKQSASFSEYDRQLLSLFYQPLTGPEPISLFLTLWADAETNIPRTFNHYHLMNHLSMSLPAVFQARISLEAIGLLRSYMRMEGDSRTFVYELLPPLDADQFFHDPLLATFLFSKIGETSYRELRARFAVDKLDMTKYKEVSRNFLDVYTPVNGNAHELLNDQPLRQKTGSEGVPFDDSFFDFSLMMSGLSEQMVPRSAVAGIPQQLIAKLAFLYSLSPLDMQKVIMMALDDKLEVPEDRLRRAATDFYKMNISNTAPKLNRSYIPEDAPEPAGSQPPMSKQQELLAYFKRVSPRELLYDLIGSEPFSVDVKLAERLMNVHKLPFEVVNVLLHYIVLNNDGKITSGFAERIASHWAVKKVDSAEKAMELSRKGLDESEQRKKEGSQTSVRSRKPAREEQVPDWFRKKDATPEPVKTEPAEDDEEIENKRKALMARLESMRNEVN
ncbi:replication initiation and membrane attachment protein [Sporosarcina sp. NCCP-2716]|uniref:replication initiation and membrane attachment family protein n=1 Tax=Sporosarcina sp. NCCP-2716 TaxID=2943679 RepID=UPI0020417DDB|nr:DnaD domain protein [Sporosarcina sp. NCCP-2716]GKV69595.1 replication initiation and membrane attachment protein [Sporosarcina sp. NCCP-2716]